MFNRSLIVFKREPAVERLIEFAVKFVAASTQADFFKAHRANSSISRGGAATDDEEEEGEEELGDEEADAAVAQGDPSRTLSSPSCPPRRECVAARERPLSTR